MKLNKFLIVGFSLLQIAYVVPASIDIRAVQEEDFNALKSLGVKTFALVNRLTAHAQIEKLAKTYDALFEEERVHLVNNPQEMIGLVAVREGKIVGYFSAHATDQANEYYGRFFMVDSAVQKQGIGKKLLNRFHGFVPTITRLVCLTNKKNGSAQKLYEYFGGKKVENPAWANHLYSMLNKADYVGYEFDENVIAAFDKPVGERAHK